MRNPHRERPLTFSPLPVITEFALDHTSNHPSSQKSHRNPNPSQHLTSLVSTSLSTLTSPLVNAIHSLRTQREERVYQLMTIEERQLESAYFKTLYQPEISPHLLKQIDRYLNLREDKVAAELSSGRAQVSTKTAPNRGWSKQTRFWSEPSEGVERKIHSETGVDSESILSTDKIYRMFRLDSDQTRIASSYVKQKRKEQEESRKRVEANNLEKLNRIERQAREREECQQREETAKHQSLLKLISERVLKRQEYKDKKAEREKQFGKFMRHYRNTKPLFERKQEESFAMEKQEQQKIQDKLQTLKKGMKSIKSEELVQFEKTYMEQRQQKKEERENLKRQLQSEDLLGRKKYYLSRFHHLELNEKGERERDDTFTDQDKSDRRLKYSQLIKDKIKVEVDIQKRQQLRALIEKEERRYKRPKNFSQERHVHTNEDSSSILTKGEEIEKPDSKKEGLKFLKFAKERRNKTVSMKDTYKAGDLDEPRTTNTISHSRHLKPRRTESQLMESWLQQIRNSQLSPRLKISRIKAKLESLETKAQRAQQLSRVNSQKDHFVSAACSLDEVYLNAIRAKLELLQV